MSFFFFFKIPSQPRGIAKKGVKNSDFSGLQRVPPVENPNWGSPTPEVDPSIPKVAGGWGKLPKSTLKIRFWGSKRTLEHARGVDWPKSGSQRVKMGKKGTFLVFSHRTLAWEAPELGVFQP